MKITKVNGYEIVYTVRDGNGRKVVETTDKTKAVAALTQPGRTLDTRAL